MAYPVTYSIRRPEQYNRLTVLFRAILVIPQAILVGSGGLSILNLTFSQRLGGGNSLIPLFSIGILTFVMEILVFLAWFAILFTGRFPQSFLGFCLKIFHWQQNVAAYTYLLASPYPPFGEGPYPLKLDVQPVEEHNRLTTFFRFILAIPHFIVLFFLGIAAFLLTIVAWFAILITGEYPAGFYDFVVGVMRWAVRVTAYMLLFVDEYPPFSLEEEGTAMQPEPA
jgi:hypothetical protein